MNHYLNCTPRECREYESVTLDVPTEAVDDILTYARILSEEKNITARKAMTDIVRGVYNELFEKNYDRKNRKNAQRRGRNS
tara:strand:- start:792 stop:1034 length:243 start_codon:yes stop_codon:yes gene_type:complete